MAITATNFRLSFANASFDGTDLGGLGEVTLTVEKQGTELTAGQTGNIVWDEVDIGGRVTVALDLKEITFENFALAVGGVVSGGTLLVQSVVGAGLRANAKALVLTPIIDGAPTTDEAEILTAPLAAVGSGEAVRLAYNNPTQQQVIRATFKILPEQQADGSFLFFYKGAAPA